MRMSEKTINAGDLLINHSIWERKKKHTRRRRRRRSELGRIWTTKK
jgi:hypothetical protein